MRPRDSIFKRSSQFVLKINRRSMIQRGKHSRSRIQINQSWDQPNRPRTREKTAQKGENRANEKKTRERENHSKKKNHAEGKPRKKVKTRAEGKNARKGQPCKKGETFLDVSAHLYKRLRQIDRQTDGETVTEREKNIILKL